MKHSPGRRQRGAFLVIVALMTVALLAYFLVGLDFGRLFVVKGELQTAMDACALSAAQELDGLPHAITRAQNAGVNAANVNRVNMQSANWNGMGMMTSDGLSFRDKDWVSTAADASAVYVQCAHTQPTQPWFMGAVAAASGGALDISARAIATNQSAQRACAIPVAVKASPGSTAADLYGFKVGQWVTVHASTHHGGEFGWYNLDGSTGASETASELTSCHAQASLGQLLGTPGNQTSVDVPWNQRFGIYKLNGDPKVDRPDFTGYAYSPLNWPRDPVACAGMPGTLPCKAFAGSTPLGAHATAANYVSKRAAYASFADTGTDLSVGSLIVYGVPQKLNGFKFIATPAQHHDDGESRRLATIPVLDSSSKVIDYMCILMLAPMSGPTDDNQVEIIGLASDAPGSPRGASPCITSGLPGGVTGPRVPVLVR